MKKQKTSNEPTLKSFSNVFRLAAYRNSYDTTFNDFLTMCICAFTQNMATGLSYYEDEYLSIIKPYKERGTLNHFPELLATLIVYMELHMDDVHGNDLLGHFYEQEISRGLNGQYFTPYHICRFMASITEGESATSERVLDPSCGSGRMLHAYAQEHHDQRHLYYGIDIDPVCVKMTAINLFLNGCFGEVMCANALDPNDFHFSYRISYIPLGIFRVDDREESSLWHLSKKKLTQASSGQLALF